MEKGEKAIARACAYDTEGRENELRLGKVRNSCENYEDSELKHGMHMALFSH